MFSNIGRMLVPAIIGRFASGATAAEIDDVRKNPRRILLVKQAERLGNIVLLNSAISALKNNYSESEIDLLLPGKYHRIMEGDARINSVIPVYKREYISAPWLLLRLIKRLRGRHYDLAIDCSDVNSHSSTGAAYALLSGATITAGWDTGDFFDIRIPRYDEIIHASEMYLRLISGIFSRELRGDPYFETTSKIPMPDNPIVGINCGGRDEKKWPLENFIRIGELLSKRNIKSEFILGPDEEYLRKRVLEALPAGCKLLPLLPVSSLKETFRRYAVFLSSDSGPMHVAWSLDIPVIAIFISSETEKFRPLSEGSVVIEANGGIEPDSILGHILTALNSRRVTV